MAHVLIADDDADIRSVIGLVLEDGGHTVTEAADGNTALRLLQTAIFPYVVLLDCFWLPGSDPGTLLRLLIQAQGRMPPHAYVLCTAQSPRTYAPWLPLIEQLAMQQLAKPFDIDDLLATIAQAAVRLPVAVVLLIAPHS
jgi:CheY-like chemotaxis protein